MSEHIKHSGEQLKPLEISAEHAEKLKQHTEKLKNSETKVGDINSIRDAVEAAASVEAAAHVTESGNANAGGNQHKWSSIELKLDAYKETLRKVRRHLTPTEKRLSTVIHQPTVEKVSEIGAKTVMRPIGIMVGAVLSFTGSLIAYVLTKHYGYELPNSIFTVLFVGGFTIGIIGEFFLRAYKSLRTR